MQVEYKGCIYQYKTYIGYDGKPDRFNSLNLMNIKPIDPNTHIVYVPSTFSGRRLLYTESSFLDSKKEYELIIEDGHIFFYMGWFNSRITGINIPQSLTDFRTDVHPINQLYLKKIVVHKDNPKYDSRNNSNCLIETKTNTLILIGADSKIPDGIEKIGYRTFYHRKDLSNFYFPSTVTDIDSEAFYEATFINGITISPNIKHIGGGAFQFVKGIKSIDLPNIESIGPYAFSRSDIETITLGNKLTHLETAIFSRCEHIKELTLPDSLIHITEGAFAFSGIKTIYCNERVADLVVKSGASSKINLVINNAKPISIKDILEKPGC